MSHPEKCPTCGSTDLEVLRPPCDGPEDTDWRHVPFDEFADDWHSEAEWAPAYQEAPSEMPETENGGSA